MNITVFLEKALVAMLLRASTVTNSCAYEIVETDNAYFHKPFKTFHKTDLQMHTFSNFKPF